MSGKCPDCLEYGGCYAGVVACKMTVSTYNTSLEINCLNINISAADSRDVMLGEMKCPYFRQVGD